MNHSPRTRLPRELNFTHLSCHLAMRTVQKGVHIPYFKSRTSRFETEAAQQTNGVLLSNWPLAAELHRNLHSKPSFLNKESNRTVKTFIMHRC